MTARTLPGAVPIDLPVGDMRSAEHSLDLRPARRTAPAPRVPAPAGGGPDLAALEELGRNHNGDLVVRDGAARYILPRDGEGGRFIAETPVAAPAEFLRATSERDIPGLAEGLWLEMEAGTVHLDGERLLERAVLALEPAGDVPQMRPAGARRPPGGRTAPPGCAWGGP